MIGSKYWKCDECEYLTSSWRVSTMAIISSTFIRILKKSNFHLLILFYFNITNQGNQVEKSSKFNELVRFSVESLRRTRLSTSHIFWLIKLSHVPYPTYDTWETRWVEISINDSRKIVPSNLLPSSPTAPLSFAFTFYLPFWCENFS